MAAMQAAIAQFKGCNPEELRELAGDLDELGRMAEKLRAGRVDIAVFGEISTGKSALINALCGEQRAAVNVRGGWTKDVWHVPWDSAGYCVPGFEDSQVVLVDTPGLNEVDGAHRGEMAHAAATRADLVLFVTDSDLNDTEYRALVELAASNKPLLLVLNKADLYRPDQLEDLLTLFRGPRLAGIVRPENIVTAQADPRDVEYVIESADGSTRSRMAEAEAAGGRGAGADRRTARRGRQGAARAERRDLRRRQERPHEGAAGAISRGGSGPRDLELRRHQGDGRGATTRWRWPTCWAASPSTRRWW